MRTVFLARGDCHEAARKLVLPALDRYLLRHRGSGSRRILSGADGHPARVDSRRRRQDRPGESIRLFASRSSRRRPPPRGSTRHAPGSSAGGLLRGLLARRHPVYAFGSLLNQGRFTAADFAVNSLNHPDPITKLADESRRQHPPSLAGGTSSPTSRRSSGVTRPSRAGHGWSKRSSLT